MVKPVMETGTNNDNSYRTVCLLDLEREVAYTHLDYTTSYDSGGANVRKSALVNIFVPTSILLHKYFNINVIHKNKKKIGCIISTTVLL